MSERRTWPFSSSALSAASSSISVVAVPFDVTGEGPTISLLGLIRWAELGLINELGRRDWGSWPEEEAIYCEGREDDSDPAESGMSAYDRYLEAMLPVDDLKGASRAIAPRSWPGE